MMPSFSRSGAAYWPIAGLSCPDFAIRRLSPGSTALSASIAKGIADGPGVRKSRRPGRQSSARARADCDLRGGGPIVAVSCPTIPAGLIKQ